MSDDATLLGRYAAEKSGDAFAELVRRHLPLVYSAALRRLGGDVHRAEDIAQEVFRSLARHARPLSRHPSLTAWLYTATRNAALDALRRESRRRSRETTALAMQETSLDSAPPADWSQLRPVLDSAMDELSETDRQAVLLRFFQQQPFAAIAHALGLSEDAARKRVDRALDKLRDTLRRHGIASTSAALGTLLAQQTLTAAPAALATAITGAALTAHAATGTAAVFALTKMQTALATIVLAGGAAGLVVQQQRVSNLRTENTALAQAHAATEAERARLSALLAAAERNASTAPNGAAHGRVGATTLAPIAGNASTITPTAKTPPAMQRGAGSHPASHANANADAGAEAEAANRALKAKLHRRYDPFLTQNGLTPAQADRFVELKIAIADAQADLQAAMRQAGAAGGTAGIEAMRSRLVQPMWDEIRALLGPDAYRSYGDFERTSAFRLGYVEPLLPSFAAAGASLSGEQADALVRVFAANSRSVRANPTDLGTSGRMDWDAVLQEARPLLTPAQASVLEEQLARRKATPR